MSHIVQIQTEVRDPVAILAACKRLHLPISTFGETQLFSSRATGWGVQLPDWKYPIVCDINTAQIAYDNFNGRWGQQSHFDSFLQSYAVEKTKLEARRQGHAVLEQPLSDGSIKVTLELGGAA